MFVVIARIEEANLKGLLYITAQSLPCDSVFSVPITISQKSPSTMIR